ncbi:sodium-dependent bicarbonate transport family permease [Noviherbaspirillum aerium]|uniref:sodium-dependent bicarbonate transport family permease n=1 Tax=Noviherbaspirillum aerium TaxID=2588497 RepID=UPI00124E17F8|nr:sodium-dependent bicarbonate transport family permease [Noviherbaspirillum aerium]
MQNFLDPAILFFAVGVLAGCLKSNLEIPQPISRFLSLYLLMALGLKGGFALAKSGLTSEIAVSLGCAILLAVVIPLAGYQFLKRILPSFDAAAVAATYGSVSAVTFITATQYLDGQQLAYGGHMAAAMALMESPAIIIAVLLANSLRQSARAQPVLSAGGTAVLGGTGGPVEPTRIGKILHESFTDGTQLLLIGAMLVGLLTGDAGKAAMAPFTIDLFKGMLAFFLLDMGLLTARNLGQLRGRSPWLILYAVLAPVAHAAFALGLSIVCGIAAGNAALLMVLAASASYIAVPAVVRYSIPEANPSVYFGMSLGVTFPLNIVIGIPAYTAIAHSVLG